MKKLVTLFFAAALVTAASAQSEDRYRNDSRNNKGYQSSPYSNNDQYSNDDYYNKNSQRNDRYARDRYYRERQRIARQRYEYEMMMRRRQALNHQRVYNNYPYGVSRKPSLQIRIGIGGRRY